MIRALRPGDVLADRYRLVDLLVESGDGRFWRGHDLVLDRHVALHTIRAEDPRAEVLLEAARRSTLVVDRRMLRVLDASVRDGVCYVVNEWGSGVSLDILVGGGAVIGPRQAAWMVGEVAEAIARAHDRGVAHGRLVPENLLVDQQGQVRIIGLCVDAALHGLAFDEPERDVEDLAGLLYCALTASWCGTSASDVRAAPVEHGQALRPRRVRAGIPRPLDHLCDEVLNRRPGGRSAETESSAAAVSSTLHEFVGDPAGVPESLAETLPPVRERFPVALPPEPTELAPPDPEPAPRDRAVPPDDQPTQAALPAFETSTGTSTTPGAATTPHPDAADSEETAESDETEESEETAERDATEDSDERPAVEARSRRRPPPGPPPPPFPDPPERPLFAPDQPERSTLQVRVPAGAGGGGGHATPPGFTYPSWGPEGPEGPDADTGLVPAVEDGVPGRTSLRLALVLGLVVLLVVGTVVAYNLGRGRTVLGTEPEPSPGPSASETAAGDPAPLTGVTATDLDPQGEDGTENPDQAQLAVDGDTGTAWTTVNYFQQLGPAGLKTGVGLTLDLGEERVVASVELAFEGEPTDATVFLSDEEPEDVTGLSALGRVAGAGAEATVTADDPVNARYVVVWLTSLPPAPDGFSGGVREVVVLGG